MQPAADSYLFTELDADAFATNPVPNLTMVRVQTSAAIPFVVLDQFGQPLRLSGRILVETAAELSLLSPDTQVARQPTARSGPFLADLADGPVRRALGNLSPLRSFAAVGAGTLQHVTAAFVDKEGKTRCRVVTDILKSSQGRVVVLARISGMRGYEKALAAVRQHAVVCGGEPFDAGDVYDALCPELVTYVSKPEVSFAPGDPAFRVASDIIAAYIPVARANEAGVADDIDTEFLHDYRIALRKIRSVLSLFKGVYEEGQTADLKARFAKLMEPTGRLRDLDVYLLEKGAYYDLLPMSLHGGLDAQFDVVTRERKSARARLARHLRSKAYEREITELAALFAKKSVLEPGPHADMATKSFGCALIRKRYRKICRIAEGIRPHSQPETVHALRIECKKLRYLMEFFGQLFPKEEFRSLTRPLKELQDNLGLVNDYAVQQVNLQRLLKGSSKANPVGDMDIAQSIGALTAVLHQRQVAERAKTVESLRRFNSPAVRKTFRKLFHARKDRT
jgi:CHAD domain-containing protein